MLSAAFLAGSVGHSRLVAGVEDLLPRARAPLTSPDRTAVAQWLWPGAFEVRLGDSRIRQTSFVAAGRRYVAHVSSEGFQVRRSTHDTDAIDIRFAGAKSGETAELSGKSQARLSLFGGQLGGALASQWQRFSASTFHNIYPGIDAKFHTTDGDLELDFLLKPGSNPDSIQLVAENSTHFAVDDSSGDILVTHEREHFRLHRPRAFQPTDKGPRPIEVRAITDGRSLHFELPQFDQTLPVVIDPLIATWSTFLGTNTDAMYDNAMAVATDAQGNLYVGGLTELSTEEQPSDSFPTTRGSLDPPYSRSPGDNCAYQCGYLLKLSPSHQVLYGALMYGMTVKAVAVDGTGSAYITGTTLDSSDFPATAGVFDNDPAGEAFVAKISADGGSFVYSALFYGDMGNGIAVDAAGDAFVVGQVTGPNLPTTPGSLKPANPVGMYTNQDGFILKINPSGSALLYGTYLGGSGSDVANAVQVDAQGEALVVGQTASADFTGMTAALSGPSDAFLIKVSADGSQILSGQTFGGSGDDFASGLAADGQGGWLMCGTTTSADLPTTANAFQTHLLGQRNGWVRRVDASLNTVFATYFGGSYQDGCLNIASDGNANAYLVGVTFSADVPTTADAFQDVTSEVTDDFFSGLSSEFYSSSNVPDREAYFAELSSDGTTLLYGSYLGGFETFPRNYPPLTIGEGITSSPSGTIYVSGATEAASFPVTDGGLRNGMGGEQDGFIVAFAPSSMSITTPSLLPGAPLQLPYDVTLAASGGTAPYTWSQVAFELPDGITLSTEGVLSGSAANPQTENTGYQFTVKATDAIGNVAYKSMIINVTFPSVLSCSANTCFSTLSLNLQIAYQIPPLARGVQPQVFTVTGQLPPGISVSSTGALTGAATQTGEYQFAFNITDAVGHTGRMNWDITVVASSTPNATLAVSPTSVTLGQSFSLNWTSAFTSGCIAGGGGAEGTNWSGTLPPSGSVTHTASQTGSFVYTISCADGTASQLKAQATLTVTNPPPSSGTGGSAGSGKGGGGELALLDIGALVLLLALKSARGRTTPAHPLIFRGYSFRCCFPSLVLIACPIASRVTSGAPGPWAIDARCRIRSSRELTRGNGESGIGTPRNLHSGGHPCVTSYTSRRSAGTIL